MSGNVFEGQFLGFLDVTIRQQKRMADRAMVQFIILRLMARHRPQIPPEGDQTPPQFHTLPSIFADHRSQPSDGEHVWRLRSPALLTSVRRGG